MFKPNGKQIKYTLLGVILIALFAFSGRYGYKYIKKEEQTLKTQILDLESDIVLYNDSLGFYSDRLNELDVKEKNYYYDYVKEYNRRIKAEKALKDIRYLVFDREYLDSLAKHIRFD